MLRVVQSTENYYAMQSASANSAGGSSASEISLREAAVNQAPAGAWRGDSASISPTSRMVGEVLARMPGVSLDSAGHEANAQRDLNVLTTMLGIPASTRIDIQSNNDGSFVVRSGNDAAAARIEQMLNDGSAKALRNDLIGMENSLKIQQVGNAAYQAQQQVDADPAMAAEIYNSLPSISSQIMSQSFSLSFADQRLSYTLA